MRANERPPRHGMGRPIELRTCGGAGSRNRTHDQRFTKPLLYQLSYAGLQAESPRETAYLMICRCEGRLGLSASESFARTAAIDSTSLGAVALTSDATGSVAMVNANP